MELMAAIRRSIDAAAAGGWLAAKRLDQTAIVQGDDKEVHILLAIGVYGGMAA